MKRQSSEMNRLNTCLAGCKAWLGIAAVTGSLLMAGRATAQTTNAYDQASDTAYDNMNAGDGLGTAVGAGTVNGGFGFGPWAINRTGTGGAFIQGSGPSGRSFDLWNTSANSSTIAIRPLGSILSVGQSIQVKLRLNSLDGSSRTNALILQDSGGNTLFAYWHVGGDNSNGHYTDASAAYGTAVNFPYAYQQFQTFTFTLTSATTYTFTDNSSGGQVTGTISGTISQIAFFRGSQAGTGGGQDFQFDQLTVTSASPPVFQSVSPAPNALSVATNATIVLSVLAGSTALDTNSILLKLDGNTVSPTVTGNTSLANISYVPSPVFGYSTSHTVQVIVSDNSSLKATNTWSFTTGYGSLPVALPGIYAVSNGQDLTIFTGAGEGWLGTNYQANSSRTLYTCSTMTVLNNAGESGGGGFYCGYNYANGNTLGLIVGNNWGSLNWSYDGQGTGAGQHDLNPAGTVINLNEVHTVVTRVDYNPAGNDTVTIYLDPDLTQPEIAQNPGNVTTFNADMSFDNIRLRCGNGNNAVTVYSNVIVSATATPIFPATTAPSFQALIPATNAIDVSSGTVISAQVVPGNLRITGVAMTVDGISVTPMVTASGGTTNITYQPPTPLSAGGAVHTVQITVTDSSSANFTQAWSFTTGYDSLPLTVAGPLTTGGGNDLTLFSAGSDAWLGTNYNNSSSRTLYTRYSMVFSDLNSEIGGGGGYGGLHFMQGNSQNLIVGNAWVSLNWSGDASANQFDLNIANGALPVTLGEGHTIVVRTDYVPNGNDNVTIYFDPDFTKPEVNQDPQNITHVTNDISFDNIRLRCGNGTASATWSNIMVGARSVDVGFATPPGVTFQNYTPGQNATSVNPGSSVSVNAVYGAVGINPGAVTMTVDGNTVTPSFSPTATYLTITYQPAALFVVGSSHAVVVSLTDSNGTPASTSWNFTVDPYPALPVTIAGLINDNHTANGDLGTTIWSSQNGWLASGTYLNTNYSGTLWTRFSMDFDDLNGETGGGGGYGGLHFYNGTNEKLLIGNNWPSLNWSYDANNWGAGDFASSPIVLGEWHTFVVKTVYVPGNVDQVKVWLDPDFTHTETGQLNQPSEILADVSFDSVHIRAGNGTASANYSNIVISATSPFPASVPRGVLSLQGGQISWTGLGALQQAPAVTGPWSDVASQANPQPLSTTGNAQFYRLRQ